MSNAQRFINSYNKIDSQLRTVYGYRPQQSFSDIVRRTAPLNSTIRRYEMELIDYSRLRNAIVHKTIDEVIIAEPCDEVTERIELIERLILTPPKVVDYLGKKDIVTIDGKTSLRAVIKLIASSSFSNIPVIDNGAIIGIVNNKRIVLSIASAIERGLDVDVFLKERKVKDIVKEGDFGKYYAIADENTTIEEILKIFENEKKLVAILITKNGTFLDKVENIVTTADLVTITKVLEDY